VSIWASKFVAVLIHGLPARDPTTLIGAVLVLFGVGAMAAWFPSRRAVRIDPAAVLRES
jgi:ABC-type antimicrobial peptide transport system permease subunit